MRKNIAVVIPVKENQRTIRQCVTSILGQDYTGGYICIFVVGKEKDPTWDVIDEFVNTGLVTPVIIEVDPDWVGRDANLKRVTGCEVVKKQDYDIDVIALTDAQIFAPHDWISKAVRILDEKNVSCIAGITVRHPGDSNILSACADSGIIQEHSRFGKEFILTRDNFRKAPGYPVTANLVFTTEFFQNTRHVWPVRGVIDYEDFYLAEQVCLIGHSIFCTDTLQVWRLHIPSMRLGKHFYAGVAFRDYCRKNSDGFAKKRLWLAYVSTILLLLLVCGILIFGIAGVLCELLLMSLILGAINTIKARTLRGFVFPSIFLLQLCIWLVGFWYGRTRKSHGTESLTHGNSLRE